ncbi:MAG: helix-turn-helix transcriptional regulator [Coriobacteriia bacterium]|nr:helix-turn-helix transcriptional regulator [Coriobacteriia bacterium]
MNDESTHTLLSADRLAEIAKALSHPARIAIVRMLAEQSECSGAEIFSGIPLAQSTISEHLRVLKEAGIVHATPVGTSMVYCVTVDPLAELAASLSDIATSTPSCSSPAEKNGTCR